MLKNDKNKSESRRARLTKRLIKDALSELLQSKQIGAITVKELCQRAEINRSTFYAYYDDVFAALADIEQDFLKKIPLTRFENQRPLENVHLRDVVLEYIRYVEQNREAFIALRENGMLTTALYDYVLQSNLDIFAPGISDPQLYQLLVRQINTGTSAMLIQWLGGSSFTAEEMAEIILSSMPSPKKVLEALEAIGYIQRD